MGFIPINNMETNINIEDKYSKILFLHKKIISPCKKCEDGFVYTEEQDEEIDFYPSRKFCDCRKEFNRLSNYILANIPQNFWSLPEEVFDIRCKEYDFDNCCFGNKKSFNLIYKKYIKNKITVMENGYSLLFSGMNGTGKTFIATLILKHFIKNYPCYYIHFRELLDMYYTAFIGKDKKVKSLLNYILNIDILCIDEIGKENNPTTVVLSEFEYWLKTRSENQKPTMLITNHRIFTKEEDKETITFRNTYGESIWDILKQLYRLFIFDPDLDFRKKTRQSWSI